MGSVLLFFSGDPDVSPQVATAIMVVHFNIFIYALSFWLQRPVEVCHTRPAAPPPKLLCVARASATRD